MYIINSVRNCISSTSQKVVYHQCKALHIIKPTEYTPKGVMRYKDGIAALDDIHADA